MGKFRMFVDESGNADLANRDSRHRYLGLVGVVINITDDYPMIQAGLLSLKRQIWDPDDAVSVCLHRKEIMNKTGVFSLLKEDLILNAFNENLLELLKISRFTIISAVADKQALYSRYADRCANPYHYCLEILLERYYYFLCSNSATGDVLAEQRGAEPDLKLKNVYRLIFEHGNEYITDFSRILSSCELKVKGKNPPIAGLEIADTICHPITKLNMKNHNVPDAEPGPFGQSVIDAVIDKIYYRKVGGKKIINGTGLKYIK